MPGITAEIQQIWIYVDRARDYARKRSFSGNMNFYFLKVVPPHLCWRTYRHKELWTAIVYVTLFFL